MYLRVVFHDTATWPMRYAWQQDSKGWMVVIENISVITHQILKHQRGRQLRNHIVKSNKYTTFAQSILTPVPWFPISGRWGPWDMFTRFQCENRNMPQNRMNLQLIRRGSFVADIQDSNSFTKCHFFLQSDWFMLFYTSYLKADSLTISILGGVSALEDYLEKNEII